MVTRRNKEVDWFWYVMVVLAITLFIVVLMIFTGNHEKVEALQFYATDCKSEKVGIQTPVYTCVGFPTPVTIWK